LEIILNKFVGFDLYIVQIFRGIVTKLARHVGARDKPPTGWTKICNIKLRKERKKERRKRGQGAGNLY